MAVPKAPIKEGYFCVGVIANAHSIKGEVNVRSFTDVPADFMNYGPLVSVSDVTYTFKGVREAKKGFLTYVEGVNSRNDAEKLRGTFLYALLENLPELSDEEMFVKDLVGTALLREDGTKFGTIKGQFDNGAHLVLTVKMPEQGVPDVMIPFTENVILGIDHDAKEIIVSDLADMFAEF